MEKYGDIYVLEKVSDDSGIPSDVYKIRPGVYEIYDPEKLLEYSKKYNVDQSSRRLIWIGKIINDLRTKKGYSFSELGRRSGVDKSVISRMEARYNYNVSSMVIQKLADALDCSPLYLTGYIDTLYPEQKDDFILDPLEKEIIRAFRKADPRTKLIVQLELKLEDFGKKNQTGQKRMIYANGKKLIEIKESIAELMREYDEEEIDGATYAQKMIELASAVQNENNND